MGLQVPISSNQHVVNNDKGDWFEAATWGTAGCAALSTIPLGATLTGFCGIAALASLGANSNDAPTYLALSLTAGYITYRCTKANIGVAAKAFQHMSNCL
jgi:hypothetical protein